MLKCQVIRSVPAASETPPSRQFEDTLNSRGTGAMEMLAAHLKVKVHALRATTPHSSDARHARAPPLPSPPPTPPLQRDGSFMCRTLAFKECSFELVDDVMVGGGTGHVALTLANPTLQPQPPLPPPTPTVGRSSGEAL